MRIVRSNIIPDVLVLHPTIYHDERGRFLETHRAKELIEETGQPVKFVQANVSFSLPYVLRGLHFQTRDPQGKLLTCIQGRIQQVCVDLREGSPYYGKHVSTLLDDMTCLSVWCPPGFGNGFLVMGSQGAVVHYECTTYYVDEYNGAVNWNDPDIGIKWGLQGRNPILSRKDRAAPMMKNVKPIRVGKA